jgi:hypothetical protein
MFDSKRLHAKVRITSQGRLSSRKRSIELRPVSLLGALLLVMVATVQAESQSAADRRAAHSGSTSAQKIDHFDDIGDGEQYWSEHSHEPILNSIHAGANCQCARCASHSSGQFWASVDALLWWTDSQTAPPLVTSSPVGTSPATSGVLGPFDTEVLYGGGLAGGVNPGGRVQFGWWLADSNQGLEASYLGLGQSTQRFTRGTSDTPILARPVINALTGEEAAMLISHPDLLQGSVSTEARTEIHSFEIMWRNNLTELPQGYVDFLAGYRFNRLGESLTIHQSSQWSAAQGQVIPGTTLDLFDEFQTRNNFHGVQLGFAYGRSYAPWYLELIGKVAIGNSQSKIRIDGGSQTSVPNFGSAEFPGGLLAQAGNMGTYERNYGAVNPELGVNLVRDLSCYSRLRFGYSLLYWNSVARAADQVDRTVSQFPPEPATGGRPRFEFVTNSFWAQGLHMGLDFTF